MINSILNRIHGILFNLTRAFQPEKFLFALLGCYVALLLNSKAEEYADFGVMYCFSQAIDYDYIFMLYFFAAVPYAICYLEETRDHYVYLYLSRAGKQGYLSDKAIAVFLSGNLTVIGGCLLYFITLLCYVPWNGDVEFNASAYDGYAILIGQGHAITFLIIRIGLLGISAGTIAVLTFLCSGWFRSLSSVYGCPVVIFFVWVTVSQLTCLPDCVRIQMLIWIPTLSNLISSVLYAVLFFLSLIVFSCKLCFPHMIRRLENE